MKNMDQALQKATFGANLVQLATEGLARVIHPENNLLLKSNVLSGAASDALLLTQQVYHHTHDRERWNVSDIVSLASLPIQYIHLFNLGLSIPMTRVLGLTQGIVNLANSINEIRIHPKAKDVYFDAAMGLHSFNTLLQQSRYRKLIKGQILLGHTWYGKETDHPTVRRYRDNLNQLIDKEESESLRKMPIGLYGGSSAAAYANDRAHNKQYISIRPNYPKTNVEADLVHECTHFLTDEYFKKGHISTDSKWKGERFDRTVGHTKDFYLLHHALVARAMRNPATTLSKQVYADESEWMSPQGRMHEIIDWNEIEKLLTRDENESLYKQMVDVRYPYHSESETPS